MDRREYESRRQTSAEYKGKIFAQASAAIPPCGFVQGLADVFLAPVHMLGAVVSRLLPGTPIDETKAMLLACSAALKKGWALYAEHRDEMIGEDRREAREALLNAGQALQPAWDRWKASQQEAYESRQRAREERAERHAAWKDRTEIRIEKLEYWHERFQEIREKKEAHIEELEEKRDSAWNDDFRERVEGWIEEEEENIRGLDEKIEDIERTLEEERRKLPSS